MAEPTCQVNDLPRPIAALIRIDPERGCWLYGRGNPIPTHYGVITVDGRQRQAHRVVYELLVGPIPDGLVLDHVRARGCQGYRCVWPGHLEPVTLAENARRNTRLARTGQMRAPVTEPPQVTPGRGWRPMEMTGLDALAEIFSSI